MSNLPCEGHHPVTLNGTIIKVPDTTPGLIVSDGTQYSFELAGHWQGSTAPALNQKVSFSPDPQGHASAIQVVTPEGLTREKLDDITRSVLKNGEGLSQKLGPYVNAQVSRMTVPVVVLSLVLLVSFLALTGWSLDASKEGLPITVSCSLYQVLGMQFTTDGVRTGLTLWSCLGLVIMLMPWVSPWLKHRHAPLLNALPLLALVLLAVVVHRKLHAFATSLTQATGQMFGRFGATDSFQQSMERQTSQLAQHVIESATWGLGYWLCLLCALGLGWLGFRKWQVLP
ncbi:hypothetical protein HKD27_11065 [Gluconobacter sp. R75690]|uniref:hypothetical protein n=1 Tax=unclassified Gluconobacter TaxID=2644261 RepID=UPI00188CBE3E|nr:MULTISPECIES: hypothetical protein [unclassified Gluconobacter]MBF0851457.1 hypothetical protein [Gluconobacter sp. R75690]MBF0880062.1 hypothetical protein [Gluconobacter sp. R75828]